VLLCALGSCGVSGASVDQPRSQDATGEGIRGAVYTVLHAQGSNAAGGTAEPVWWRTIQGNTQTNTWTDIGTYTDRLTETRRDRDRLTDRHPEMGKDKVS